MLHRAVYRRLGIAITLGAIALLAAAPGRDWARARQDASPTAPLHGEASFESISSPTAGEIAVDGVVKAVDSGKLTIAVTQIRTPDGKLQSFRTPRDKTVRLGVGSPVFVVDGDAPLPAAADDLRVGATIRCVGANGGEGTVLVARLIVVLRTADDAAAALVAARVHPYVNLLSPVNDTTNYTLNRNSEGVGAACTVDGDALKVAVTLADGQDWHLSLGSAKSIDLVDGVAYRLSFEAKAEHERGYRVMALTDRPDYHNIGLYEPFTAGVEWKTFTFTFAPHDTVTQHSTCPLFLLGKETGDLYLRNLRVTATNDPIIPGNLLQPTTNPGAWQILTYGGAAATLARENSALRVTVSHATGGAWDIQLSPHQTAVKEGESYTVRFRAWSSVARTITVSSGTSTPPYHPVGLDKKIEIGPEHKLYTLTFRAANTIPADKGVNIAPIFPVGDSPGTLFLSDISLAPTH